MYSLNLIDDSGKSVKELEGLGESKDIDDICKSGVWIAEKIVSPSVNSNKDLENWRKNIYNSLRKNLEYKIRDDTGNSYLIRIEWL